MKNNMVFFSEYRKNMESARNEINNNKESGKRMVEAIAELMTLADAAKYEGLLALEWEAEKEEITDLIKCVITILLSPGSDIV